MLSFFLTSGMVLDLFNQLQIFVQLYLVELLVLLTCLGLLELQHLIYSRLSTEFGMLVIFTNLSLTEFQVRYLDLFLLFSLIDSFAWCWMVSVEKNIQLMLQLLKALFLVLHFSYYTFMTFLMMLPVILLSVLMTLLSILSAVRHLQVSTLWTRARSDLLISMLGKLNWFHMTSLIILILLM